MMMQTDAWRRGKAYPLLGQRTGKEFSRSGLSTVWRRRRFGRFDSEMSRPADFRKRARLDRGPLLGGTERRSVSDDFGLAGRGFLLGPTHQEQHRAEIAQLNEDRADERLEQRRP